MITKVSIKDMTHEEWLQERSNSIGGSEIGTIMGFNPFQSAYSLWLERTGAKEPFKGNIATRVGTQLEELVAQMFQEKDPDAYIYRTHYIYRNDEFPHMHASPDRVICGKKGSYKNILAGLECKTTSEFNCKKFKGVDFPTQYLCQCVSYMAILEVPAWYLAVLIGNRDFKTYKIVRKSLCADPGLIPFEEWLDGGIFIDEEDINEIRNSAIKFWNCIEKNIPPEIDGSKSSTDALNEQYPYDNESSIDLTMYEMDLIQLLDVQNQMKDLEKKEETIKNVLKNAMGEAQVGTIGEHRVVWKNVLRSTLDSKKLKEVMPDVWQRFSKESVTRTFSVK